MSLEPRQFQGLAAVAHAVVCARYSDFATPFPSPPVVLAALQGVTAAPNNSFFAAARISNLTAAGFEVCIESEDTDLDGHLAETVGYIAMTPGATTNNGHRIDAALTAQVFDHGGQTHSFVHTMTGGAPKIFGQTASSSILGGGATLRQLGSSGIGVSFFVAEDLTLSPSPVHPAESLWVFVFEAGTGDLVRRIDDVTPPAIFAPVTQVVEATSALGALVTEVSLGAASGLSDDFDPNPGVTLRVGDPNTGPIFADPEQLALGDNSIYWVAEDYSGNRASDHRPASSTQPAFDLGEPDGLPPVEAMSPANAPGVESIDPQRHRDLAPFFGRRSDALSDWQHAGDRSGLRCKWQRTAEVSLQSSSSTPPD